MLNPREMFLVYFSYLDQEGHHVWLTSWSSFLLTKKSPRVKSSGDLGSRANALVDKVIHWQAK